MVGPLIAGIATGFAQASQRREASNARAAELLAKQQEAQKDRNLRIELSEADIITRTEEGQKDRASAEKIARERTQVTENQLKYQKKQAEIRNGITIGSAALNSLQGLAKDYPKGLVPSSVLSPVQQGYVAEHFHLKPENGNYNLLAYKTASENENAEKITEKLVTNSYNPNVDPNTIPDYVWDERLKKEGKKVTSENRVKIKSDVTHKFRIMQSVKQTADDLKNNANKSVRMKRVIYLDGTQSTITMPDKNKALGQVFPETFGGNSSLNSDKLAQIYGDRFNADAVRFAHLTQYEIMIQDAVRNNRTEEAKVLKNDALVKLKSDFLNLNSSLNTKKSPIIKYKNLNGDMSRIVVKGGIRKSHPLLSELFEKTLLDNSVSINSSEVSTKTVEGQKEIVASVLQDDGETEKNAKAKAEVLVDSGQIALTKNEVEFGNQRVVDTPNTYSRSNLIQNPNHTKTPTSFGVIIDINNNDMFNLEEIPMPASFQSDSVRINRPRKQAVVAKSDDNTEKVIPLFKNPLAMDNERVEMLMGLDDAVKENPNFFDDKPQLKENYENLKTIYPLLDQLEKNSKDTKNMEELRRQISIKFDFKDSNGNVNIEDVNSAMLQLLEKNAMSKLTPPSKNVFVGGKLYTKQFSIPLLPARILTSNPHLKRTQNIRNTRRKLTETKDNVDSFDQNINRLGVMKKILVAIKNNKVNQDNVQSYMNVLRQDPNLMKNNGMLQLLDTTEEEIRQTGFKEGTQQASTVVKLFQNLKDIFNAIPVAVNRLSNFKSEVGKGKIKATYISPDAFASKNDTANDNMTIRRLKQVEEYSAIKAEEYNNNINKYTQNYNDAISKNDFVGALEAQTLAYQEYILAQNDMLKTTLTYTFAGMVQGESGGRAISNEDFAILYRALWSGAGENLAEGSFDGLKDVLKNLEIRTENAIKYVDLRDGDQIASTMSNAMREIHRQKNPKLYKASMDFDLLKETKITSGRENVIGSVAKTLPPTIFSIIGDKQPSNVNQLSVENLKRDALKFYSVTRSVINKLPARIKNPEGLNIPYKSLSSQQQEEIFNLGFTALRDVLYNPRTKRIDAGINQFFESYRTKDGVNLADSIIQVDNKKKNIRHSNTPPKTRFVISVIEHMYNEK